MAGDRRATMGNVIAQRDIEKVFPADEFSIVGIAGAAGLAVEMVGLFQVELEHYEKIEGAPLSLMGKANRLATMIRGNLGMAMQGLVVVPLFAGWDEPSEQGRIFSYDATGGRYEEHAFFSVGSGSMFARGSLKKLYRPDLTAAEASMAVIQALYDAADDDSATGGPDLTRRIFPVVLVATADGVDRVADAGDRRHGHRDDGRPQRPPRRPPGSASVMSMPFYVAPEQQMKDRADFARKGIARGRSVIVLHYADGIVFVAENRSAALHKVSEIYDRIGFAAVGRYNEFERLRTAGIQYADLRGYSYDRTDVTGRGLANAYAQLLGTIFSSGGEKPYEVEIVVAELGLTPDLDQIYRLTYDGSVADEDGFAVMGGSADAIAEVVGRGYSADLALAAAVSARRRRAELRRWPAGCARASSGSTRSRSRCSTAPAPCRASSAGSAGRGWPSSCSMPAPAAPEPAPS